MNPGRFYIPRMGANFSPIIGSSYLPSRTGVGLFGRITSSLRSFNWSGLLSGANKTLNVVNQTIPLVRQAGPMLNNMKSMLRIARAFGSETKGNSNSNNNIGERNKVISSNDNIISSKQDNSTIEKEVSNDNYPNFFV